MEEKKNCCFLGHRKISETEKLKNNLNRIIENLITNEDVQTFFFGSKSEFNDLCHKVVTELKAKYPCIKRVYVRSSFQHIPDWYEDDLLEHYEATYFPEHIEKAGKASYVERNQEMINQSNFCVVYFDENYTPPRKKNSRRDLCDYQPKSGTKLAYDYAVKKKCEIINVFTKNDTKTVGENTMITLYQDTKMSVAGIAYTVPKSFYICVEEYGDVKYNRLSFTTKEKDCCIDVFTIDSDISFNVRDDFISSICDNNTYTIYGGVDERLQNSMYSIRAKFESKRHAYWEMHIGQRKGYDERVEIRITVEKRKNTISEVMKREEIKSFIDSFEVID